MPSLAEQQGFGRQETVTIDVRKWQALARQLVRSTIGWRHVEREIQRVLDACRHADGCPSVGDRTIPCLATCPDRETRLSALVVQHNAEQFVMRGQVAASLPGEYRAPVREYFDAIVTELEVLRESKNVIDEIAKYGVVEEVSVTATPVEKPLTRLLPPEPEGPGDEEDDEDTDDEDEEDEEDGT